MWQWFPNSWKSQAALPFEFSSQRDGSLSLSIHITTCGGMPVHELPQAASTHTEAVSLSALCCINYASPALNRSFSFFYSSSFYTEQFLDTLQVIIILIFRQTVGFSKNGSTLSNLVQPVPCQHGSVGELFSKERCCGPSAHCAVSLAYFGYFFLWKSKVSLAEPTLMRKLDSSYMSCLSCIIF